MFLPRNSQLKNLPLMSEINVGLKSTLKMKLPNLWQTADGPTDKQNNRRTRGVLGRLLFKTTMIQPRDEDSVPSLRNLRPMPGAVLSTSGSGSRAAGQHTEKIMFFTALILDMQYLCCLFSLSILWLSTSIILWMVVAKSISFLRAGIDILDFFYRGTQFF